MTLRSTVGVLISLSATEMDQSLKCVMCGYLSSCTVQVPLGSHHGILLREAHGCKQLA